MSTELDTEKNLNYAIYLIEILLNNDPDELIADGGHELLAEWRHNAREFLRRIGHESFEVQTYDERHRAAVWDLGAGLLHDSSD